jgi:TfoX/Sxy family transcriptional regulator of competence genes
MSTQRGHSRIGKWQPAPPEQIRLFGEMLQAFPLIQMRQMFGYPCAFFQGQMFAGLFQDSFILRLSTEDRAQFFRLDGTHPFEPMPGRPMKEYVVLPERLLTQKETLHHWLEKAFAYAGSLPAKEPKRKAIPKK